MTKAERLLLLGQADSNKLRAAALTRKSFTDPGEITPELVTTRNTVADSDRAPLRVNPEVITGSRGIDL